MCIQQVFGSVARQISDCVALRPMLTAGIARFSIGFTVTALAGLIGGPVAAIATSIAFSAQAIALLSKI